MELRRVAILGIVCVLISVFAAPASGASLGSVSVKAPGFRWWGDGEGAAGVDGSRWEPRKNNARANRRRPNENQLRDFRQRSEMVNRFGVTGHYRGTTDEILQWAARKWGFDPDLFRAVATVESYWNMSAGGAGGRSFGIFQWRQVDHWCSS